MNMTSTDVSRRQLRINPQNRKCNSTFHVCFVLIDSRILPWYDHDTRQETRAPFRNLDEG